ncbi:serine/threonine-protein phosphatase 2A 55 kDa regulatory subunit B delta isoform isoform X2 [Pteropus medius]|uniref:serine/threonine-protein phosphatase 2A 55 kDa regulatory subunit B delta isoform isoform X2 n=1 Tax=Pteropus vampyrus TaxID=132908 RepID=UPI00196B583D|nr:serine/threonine-protein phosphatase 2A 55 kDa regulatory subunit B delta isoform isoform X2 [Pteropus giganteus]
MVGTIPGGHCVENKAWEDLCTPTCQDRGPGSSAERPATISVPSTGAEQGGLRHRAARGSAGPPGWHPHSVSHAALRISPVAGVTFVSYIISTVELNHFGDLLATGDKGGGVVIFQWNKRSRHRRPQTSWRKPVANANAHPVSSTSVNGDQEWSFLRPA